MKPKYTIVTLVSSFATFALAMLILLIVMYSSGMLSKRTAGIVLPAEGEYVESWSDHLPQIAKKLNIPEVVIYTYDSEEKLENYLSQSEKYNILWAEIPVSGEYNLNKLLKSVETSTIDQKYTGFFPASLCNEIKKASGQKDFHFIPLSYDPWLIVQSTEISAKHQFEISFGGENNTNAIAFLSYIRTQNSKTGKTLSTDEALKIIETYSNDKTLIKNARSYTNKDAFIALENGTVEKCFMPASFFNSLSISQRQELSIQQFSQTLITYATIAVFPVRKSEENRDRTERAKEILLLPDMMYATANFRGCIPALNTTVSRSSYTDTIKKQAKMTSVCFIPDLQYNSKTEQQELLEKLEPALRTAFTK